MPRHPGHSRNGTSAQAAAAGVMRTGQVNDAPTRAERKRVAEQRAVVVGDAAPRQPKRVEALRSGQRGHQRGTSGRAEQVPRDVEALQEGARRHDTHEAGGAGVLKATLPQLQAPQRADVGQRRRERRHALVTDGCSGEGEIAERGLEAGVPAADSADPDTQLTQRQRRLACGCMAAVLLSIHATRSRVIDSDLWDITGAACGIEPDYQAKGLMSP